jgi:hypothetical protein
VHHNNKLLYYQDVKPGAERGDGLKVVLSSVSIFLAWYRNRFALDCCPCSHKYIFCCVEMLFASVCFSLILFDVSFADEEAHHKRVSSPSNVHPSLRCPATRGASLCLPSSHPSAHSICRFSPYLFLFYHSGPTHLPIVIMLLFSPHSLIPLIQAADAADMHYWISSMHAIFESAISQVIGVVLWAHAALAPLFCY